MEKRRRKCLALSQQKNRPDQNEKLFMEVNLEKVNKFTFHLNPNKAPGLDDFSASVKSFEIS